MVCSLLRNLVWMMRHDLAHDWGYLMATMEQFEAALMAVNDATNALAMEVARLREIIAGGGLSADQEAVVLASLSDIEAKLKAIGQAPA